MTRRCTGKQGKGCARFLSEWDSHSLCFSCRDCSQDNPCYVCSGWSTLQWSQASVAIAKMTKRTNKAGGVVQQVEASRDSSLPFSESNEGPAVTGHLAGDVEVSSAQALTTGSNPGALPLEFSTFGNETGGSSQPSCSGAPGISSGAPRPRSCRSSSEHLAARHDNRVRGSRSRSRVHRSRSGSTRLPRSYRTRSRSRSRSVRTTKSHRSCSYSSSKSGSWSGSECNRRVRSSQSRGHGHRSRRDNGSRSKRSHRSHRSRSASVRDRRSRHKSRINRRHGSRSRGQRRSVRDKSPSYSRSSHSRSCSLESRRSRDNISRPLTLSSTSGFSGFSAVPVTQPCTSDHRVQPDMRDLIRQILSEEFKSMSRGRKRSRSRSVSVEPTRREQRVSHTAPDPDPLDTQAVDVTQSQASKVNESSVASKNNTTGDSVVSANMVSGSVAEQEPEISLMPDPGETIGSDNESDDQDNDEAGATEQTSVPAQLPYIEALGSLRTRLGPQLCPEKVPQESKPGASALDFFDKKSKDSVHPSLPQSRLILDIVSKINSRVQGPNSIPGSPLDSYPKGMGTNRFPSLFMKPKVFGQDSYKISDPTLVLDPPPLDPSFREVLKQGASVPSSHNVQLQQLEGWERLARAGIHISSHADMFLYGILSALSSSAPSQSDLAEVRRYLQALAQSHMHLFDVLVRLASGPLLARRDAFLDKCALDTSLKSSLRVQPLESSTLFGPKMSDVAKMYKDDLTRRSLQNAAVSHAIPRKPKKKAGPRSGVNRLTVNTSDNGQRQVISKPAVSSRPSHSSSFSSKFKKQKKTKKTLNQK